MCCVYCRLSSKQHQMRNVFLKVVRQQCSGEVSEFLIVWCEIFSWFCTPKIVKISSFLQSYSIYRGEERFSDTEYICVICVCVQSFMVVSVMPYHLARTAWRKLFVAVKGNRLAADCRWRCRRCQMKDILCESCGIKPRVNSSGHSSAPRDRQLTAFHFPTENCISIWVDTSPIDWSDWRLADPYLPTLLVRPDDVRLRSFVLCS